MQQRILPGKPSACRARQQGTVGSVRWGAVVARLIAAAASADVSLGPRLFLHPPNYQYHNRLAKYMHIRQRGKQNVRTTPYDRSMLYIITIRTTLE